MPKNTAIKSNPPLATAGVTTVLGTTSTPPVIVGGAHAGAVQCDCCLLNLPRSASHIDVTSHACFRGFTPSLNAAGQIVLA